MYTCIIVDDEPLARKVLAEYLEELRDFQLMASFKNAMETLEFLYDNKVDVIFLDINMPKLTGLEMLNQMDEMPLVIFTTAYSEFAVEAFEVNAFDYLVKPISFDRFLKAIKRVRKYLKGQLNVNGDVDWLTIKEGRRLYKINTEDIFYLQAYGDYVRIFTEDKSYMTKRRLSNMANELPNSFMQVHRSYIINLKWLEYMEGNHVVINGEKISVSSGFKDDLISRL